MALAEDLGNGYESTRVYVEEATVSGVGTPPIEVFEPWRDIFEDHRLVRNRDEGTAWLLSPPNLSAAKSIVGLDGTPSERLWNLVTGKRFTVEQVLEPDQVGQYLTEERGYEIYQTQKGIKPYASGNYVSLDHDAALLFGVTVKHNEEPALIAPNKAIKRYEREGLTKYVSGTEETREILNNASVRSSNRFSDRRLGVVSGAPHPGDSVIQRWGALLGMAIEGAGKGVERSYGEGDFLYQHFVHDQVLQAVLRFGRDGDGATVYVNTLALPEWAPVHDPVHAEVFRGEKTREVAEYLRDTPDGATAKEIEANTSASATRVYDTLCLLREEGFVECQLGDGTGAIHRWI